MPEDKIQHLASGAALAGTLMALARLVGIEDLPVMALAAALVTAWAGILKECMDSTDPEHHTADPWDALATASGGVLGALAGAFLLR